MKKGLFLFLFFLVQILNSQTIYIHQSTDEISPGDSINIEIGISNGDSIKSITMYLDYDEDRYSFIDGEIGDLFQNPSFVDIHLDSIDNDLNVFLFAARLGAEKFVSGSGSIFSLQFKAVAVGDAEFKVDSLFFYNAELNLIDAESEPLSTVVTPDTFPPDPITDFKVLAGSEQLTFSWINPSTPDLCGVKMIRSEEGFIDSVVSGETIVFKGLNVTFIDDSVTNNTIYYYSAFTYDEIPNYSLPIFLKAQPKGEMVYAYPNPFNPDEKQVSIKIIFTNDNFINITIYSALGHHVIDFVQDEAVYENVEKIYNWDGRNGNGDLVANGVYYLVVNLDTGSTIIEKIAVLR